MSDQMIAPDLIASFAVEACAAARVDLMLGVHPEEKRNLTEEEESAGCISPWVSATARLNAADSFTKALALWRDHWPDWAPTSGARGSLDKLIEERWRSLFPHCIPIGAAYLFRPIGSRSADERNLVGEDTRATFSEMDLKRANSTLAAGHVTWTVHLHPAGPLRAVFEDLAGLTGEVKARLGLDGHDPGFLRRYATAHNEDLDQLVTPRQFEHLVADLYRAEGWVCHVTRHSKDGGVDIEAARSLDGGGTVVLIQVKRNRAASSGRRRPRPVGLDDIKAFAATVRGEGRDSGILVTSSRITRDAVKWAETNGTRVASLSFVNGADIRARLTEIARAGRRTEIASYILRVLRE